MDQSNSEVPVKIKMSITGEGVLFEREVELSLALAVMHLILDWPDLQKAVQGATSVNDLVAGSFARVYGLIRKKDRK